MNKLLYENVKPNVLVQDSEGNIGKIKAKHDIHNVEVNFMNGGGAFYCLDEDCDEYDPLYIYKFK